MSTYKVTTNETDVVQKLKDENLFKDYSYYRRGCFNVEGITVNGDTIASARWADVDYGVTHGEEIEGLYCPDCGAQAYRTDHPNIATCGAVVGWFFFYQEKEQKKKTIMKVINGELQEVEIENQSLKGGE